MSRAMDCCGREYKSKGLMLGPLSQKDPLTTATAFMERYT